MTLNHGAHRAIEQHDALFQQLLQLADERLSLRFVEGRDAEGHR